MALIDILKELRRRGISTDKIEAASNMPEIRNVDAPSQRDPVFESMGKPDQVPFFQDTQPNEGIKKAISFLTSGSTTGEIDPVGAGATLGSVLFPPLASGRVAKLFPSAQQSFKNMAVDIATPAELLTASSRAALSSGSKHAVRFTPPVLGAAGGGAAGGFVDSLSGQGFVGPTDIFQPFSSLIEKGLPTEEELSKAFESAKAGGATMGALEIGGSVIFAPIARLLGPNADKLAQEGRNVIRYAKENNLPFLPKDVTGAKGILEATVDSFFPLGRLPMKTNIDNMAKVLEAPMPDHANYATMAFKLEKDQILKEGGTLAEQNAVDAIKNILLDSATTVPTRSGIATNLKGPSSSLLINGDKLLLNIQKAQKAGLLDGLPEKTLEALQNYAMYAKVVGPTVANDSAAKGLLGNVTNAAAILGTGAIVYPLFSGTQGVDNPIRGAITTEEAATTVTAASFLSWAAASIANPRGLMNKWLTRGLVDSKIASELLRLGVDQSVKAADSAFSGSRSFNQNFAPAL